MSAGNGARTDPGPGIIETTVVFGLSAVLAAVILLAFGGQLADVIGLVVDAAHGVN